MTIEMNKKNEKSLTLQYLLQRLSTIPRTFLRFQAKAYSVRSSSLPVTYNICETFNNNETILGIYAYI